MSVIGLKSILKRNQGAARLLQQAVTALGAQVWLEDKEGKLLFGQQRENPGLRCPVIMDSVVLGYACGCDKAEFIATWLGHWLGQEQAKQKLGAEVLHLYREINLIFNFSEQLASAVGAEAIAHLALQEAGRLIAFNSGAVVFQREPDALPEILVQAGEPVIPSPEQLQPGGFYKPIISSGTSEIIRLPVERGNASHADNWLLYATLKVKHRILGSIILIRFDAPEFTAADLKLLTTLALQSAAAMESALLHEEATARALEQQREQLVIELAMRDAFFRKVASIIEHNLADPEFNVEQLSRAVHLSTSQLQRKIITLTDKTPLQVIRDLRLRKAKDLLLNSDMTVSEVAWQCGFSDPSYFTRIFTREAGQTPTAWKETQTQS